MCFNYPILKLEPQVDFLSFSLLLALHITSFSQENTDLSSILLLKQYNVSHSLPSKSEPKDRTVNHHKRHFRLHFSVLEDVCTLIDFFLFLLLKLVFHHNILNYVR